MPRVLRKSKGPNDVTAAAFTLVEVASALGILAFAIISMVGLVSVGLNGSRENRQRTAETQILDWVQSAVREASEKGTLDQLTEVAHEFDQSGLFLAERGSPEGIYVVTLRPGESRLPGSRQSLGSIEVEIRSAVSSGNQVIFKRALWFNK